MAELDHHGFPSWRVRGKILATLPHPDGVNVMVAEGVVRETVAENPTWCQPCWWGKRLAAVTVRLSAADPVVVRELLVEAWRRKAPVSLVKQHRELG